MRILIVDDSRTIRSILRTYAGNLGIQTLEAEDGLDAIAKLEENERFDAVLIDWDMPRMNGIELLKHIRANPEYDSVKTMMVTAQSSYAGVTEALGFGADDYLMKPLDEEMFSEKLKLLGLVA